MYFALKAIAEQIASERQIREGVTDRYLKLYFEHEDLKRKYDRMQRLLRDVLDPKG